MPDVFLWSLVDAKRSASVLLWSKVVITIGGPRVTRVTGLHVHPSEERAREAALAITRTSENLGSRLADIYGHRGWDTLAEQMDYAHHLHIGGREEYALTNVVDGIATRIVRDGMWLRG